MPRIQKFPEGDDLWVIGGLLPVSMKPGGSLVGSTDTMMWRLGDLRLATVERWSAAYTALHMADWGSRRNFARSTSTEYPLSIGLAPLTMVGTLIQKRQIVGWLNMEALDVDLDFDDEDADAWTVASLYGDVGSLHDRQCRWSDALSHFGGGNRVVRIQRGDEIIIIPRYEIFRFFYGCHSEIAKAVTSDLWAHSRDRVVDPHPLKNGLVTRINPTTGAYEIILRPRIPNDYAQMLGILYFDPYAVTCANSIFGFSVKDRSLSDWRHYHHAARVPFHGLRHHPLRMTVLGWWMPGLPRTFWVSSISRFRVPDYIPPVWYQRDNGGDRSGKCAELRSAAAPPATPPALPVDADDEVFQDVSADARKRLKHWEAPSVSWESRQCQRRLDKPEHIQSDGTGGQASPGKADLDETSAVSPGASTSGSTLPHSLQVEARVSASLPRFRSLLSILEDMKQRGRIDAYEPIAPRDVWQRQRVGNIPCWHVVAANEMVMDQFPRNGWGMPRCRDSDSSTLAHRYPRCVLIVRIRMDDAVVHWIEIECVGGEGYHSVVVTGISEADEAQVLPLIIISIRTHKGRCLDDRIPEDLRGLHQVQVVNVRHSSQAALQAQSDTSRWSLSSRMVERGLRRSGVALRDPAPAKAASQPVLS